MCLRAISALESLCGSLERHEANRRVFETWVGNQIDSDASQESEVKWLRFTKKRKMSSAPCSGNISKFFCISGSSRVSRSILHFACNMDLKPSAPVILTIMIPK